MGSSSSSEKVVLNIQLDHRTKRKLQEFARLEGVSVAEVVRKALAVAFPLMVQESRSRMLDRLNRTDTLLN